MKIPTKKGEHSMQMYRVVSESILMSAVSAGFNCFLLLA